MANSKLQIPEPTLPEHILIRECAPTPRLTTGLKSRIMVECHSSISQARRVRRWKMTGATTLFCCLGLLFCLSVPQTPTSPTNVTEQDPTATQHQISSGSSLYPDISPLTVDTPVAPVNPDKVDSVDELMEELGSRNELLEANILPKF